MTNEKQKLPGFIVIRHYSTLVKYLRNILLNSENIYQNVCKELFVVCFHLYMPETLFLRPFSIHTPLMVVGGEIQCTFMKSIVIHS